MRGGEASDGANTYLVHCTPSIFTIFKSEGNTFSTALKQGPGAQPTWLNECHTNQRKRRGNGTLLLPCVLRMEYGNDRGASDRKWNAQFHFDRRLLQSTGSP